MSRTLIAFSLLSLVRESVQSLPGCDYTLFPETGCAAQLMTSCVTSTMRCVCNSGYPIEVNGRCFEYKSVGKECITSSQCYKAKCVDHKTGEEIVSENGVEANRKGICKCTDDRFLDPVKKECVQRFIHKKCSFFGTTTDCGTYAYCDRGRCTCRPGFVYDILTDQCIPTPIQFSPPCYAGFITVTENGTTRCRHRADPGGYYPYFRRPSYANLMWPIFAFFLVLLMFKLLKEGMERECPPPSSTSSSHMDPSSRRAAGAASRLNLLLPVPRVSGPSHSNRSAQTTGVSSSGFSSQGQRGAGVHSPSLDTIISLPPPYDSQTLGVRTINPGDQPPSYEEATRKE